MYNNNACVWSNINIVPFAGLNLSHCNVHSVPYFYLFLFFVSCLRSFYIFHFFFMLSVELYCSAMDYSMILIRHSLVCRLMGSKNTLDFFFGLETDLDDTITFEFYAAFGNVGTAQFVLLILHNKILPSLLDVHSF